jgi:hypothetical protein
MAAEATPAALFDEIDVLILAQTNTQDFAVATVEAAMLAPKAEVSMFPWKEPKERIPLAVRQIRSFLGAHRPASV